MSSTSAASTLDVFGTIGGSASATPGRADLRPGDAPAYFVTRGNHDRVHTRRPLRRLLARRRRASCSDCFSDVFAPSWEPGTTHFSVTIGDDRARYRFVGLDSNDGERHGRPARRRARLPRAGARPRATSRSRCSTTRRRDLAGAVADAVPVRSASSTDARGLPRGRRRATTTSAASTPATPTATTAAWRTGTGHVPYFEGGAVKEYPGGYTQVRLFEGGYMVNFFKTSAPDARAWSERRAASTSASPRTTSWVASATATGCITSTPGGRFTPVAEPRRPGSAFDAWPAATTTATRAQDPSAVAS